MQAQGGKCPLVLEITLLVNKVLPTEIIPSSKILTFKLKKSLLNKSTVTLIVTLSGKNEI